jgi:hypothetical protein
MQPSGKDGHADSAPDVRSGPRRCQLRTFCCEACAFECRRYNQCWCACRGRFNREQGSHHKRLARDWEGRAQRCEAARASVLSSNNVSYEPAARGEAGADAVRVQRALPGLSRRTGGAWLDGTTCLARAAQQRRGARRAACTGGAASADGWRVGRGVCRSAKHLGGSREGIQVSAGRPRRRRRGSLRHGPAPARLKALRAPKGGRPGPIRPLALGGRRLSV